MVPTWFLPFSFYSLPPHSSYPLPLTLLSLKNARESFFFFNFQIVPVSLKRNQRRRKSFRERRVKNHNKIFGEFLFKCKEPFRAIFENLVPTPKQIAKNLTRNLTLLPRAVQQRQFSVQSSQSLYTNLVTNVQ